MISSASVVRKGRIYLALHPLKPNVAYLFPSCKHVEPQYTSTEARCIYCANKFAPPPVVLQAISDKLDPEEKESALNTACPHCNGKLKFNPFYVHNYDTTN